MSIDPNIKQKADDIRKKVYGSEVRESLASGLEAMSSDVVENEGRQSVVESRQDSVESQWQDVIEETTGKDVISAPEIIAARNNEDNLKARLDKENQEVTAQLAQTGNRLNNIGIDVTQPPFNLALDGITDETQPFRQAIEMAIGLEVPLFIPYGIAYIPGWEILSTDNPVSIKGNGIIRGDGNSHFLELGNNLHHEGVKFEDLLNVFRFKNDVPMIDNITIRNFGGKNLRSFVSWIPDPNFPDNGVNTMLIENGEVSDFSNRAFHIMPMCWNEINMNRVKVKRAKGQSFRIGDNEALTGSRRKVRFDGCVSEELGYLENAEMQHYMVYSWDGYVNHSWIDGVNTNNTTADKEGIYLKVVNGSASYNGIKDASYTGGEGFVVVKAPIIADEIERKGRVVVAFNNLEETRGIRLRAINIQNDNVLVFGNHMKGFTAYDIMRLASGVKKVNVNKNIVEGIPSTETIVGLRANSGAVDCDWSDNEFRGITHGVMMDGGTYTDIIISKMKVSDRNVTNAYGVLGNNSHFERVTITGCQFKGLRRAVRIDATNNTGSVVLCTSNMATEISESGSTYTLTGITEPVLANNIG